MTPNRCCICRGTRQVGELKDRVFVEPFGDDRPQESAITRGWMCEECAIVHWAWLVKEVNSEA